MCMRGHACMQVETDTDTADRVVHAVKTNFLAMGSLAMQGYARMQGAPLKGEL